MYPDHYQALGVHPLASQAEIRAAYLRLMRANHPDRRPGDPGAADVARRANAAWDVLGHAARRASYDRLRAAGRRPAVRVVGERTGVRVRAYSPDRAHYRRVWRRASLRIALTVLALGSVLLFLVR